MSFLSFLPASRAILSAKWRSWLIVATVLLATHALSAGYYAARYENREVIINGNVLTLDMTPEEWAKPLSGMDAAAYLKVAENFATGKGVTMPARDSGSTHDAPFFALLLVRGDCATDFRYDCNCHGIALDQKRLGARRCRPLHGLLPTTSRMVLRSVPDLVGNRRASAPIGHVLCLGKRIRRLP
jgi:hypothetical protein